jgi:type III secretion protein L
MGAIVCVKSGSFQVRADAKVIKAGEYLEYEEASSVLEQARNEAEKILERANALYESEKERGYQDGLTEAKKKMTGQMMDIVTSSVDYFESVEEKITSIVMATTRKVIGTVDDRELITGIVRNALAMTKNQKQIILRVAPDQVDLIKARLDEITADFPARGFIEVTADRRLTTNGCIVESEIGVVDASIDVQLEAIRKSLIKSFRKAR